MKIILVNRYFYPDESATSRMVSSLGFALAETGIDVTALCSRERYHGLAGELAARERINNVEIVRLRTMGARGSGLSRRALDYLTFHLSCARWLLRNLRRGEICVVCTDPPLMSVSAALPIRLRNARMINWVMDLFPEVAMELGILSPRGIAGRVALLVRDWSLGMASLVVCPIEAMRKHLENRSVAPGRLAVLNHWADGSEVVPVAHEHNPLRRAWALEGKFIIGYSGNFGRAHEFDTILDAAERLQHADDMLFLLIGDGPRRADVQAEVMRRGLRNVVFKPFQSRECLSESLGVSDVHLVSLIPNLEHCIVPSKFYGILAAGRPTLFLGAAEGEVARAADQSGCGRRVAIGDPTGLTTAILALRDSPAGVAVMGAAARQLYLSHHQRARGVQDWCRILASVVDTSPVLFSGNREAAG